MRRRNVLAGALAIAATAAAAPQALAADQTVQAVDGTAGDNFNHRWDKSSVSIVVGDTVTWSFAGTAQPHNVQSEGSNWSLTSPIAIAQPPKSFTFSGAGEYVYICQVHPTTMRGTVRVGTTAPPPPPPPPPLSEQPYRNDQSPPPILEITDETAPALARVRASGIRRGAKVRFRVSEPSRVSVRFKRGGRTVKTRTFRARRGTRTVTVRGLRAGRYRVEVRARDLGGNRSPLRRTSVRVR